MKKRFTLLAVISGFLIIALLFLAPAKLNAQTTILYGNNIQTAISAVGELDSYLFTGSPNDVIRLIVTRSSGGPSFVPLVEIYRPNGSLFKRLLGSNLVFDTTLTDAGTYTIWIMDDNGLEGGNYGLTLQRLNPTMGTAINYGENKQAAIGLTAELDSYLFTGSPNDVIRLIVTRSSGGPSFVPLVEIYRPNGSLFKRLLGSNLVFDTTLTDAGTYTIWIMDDNGLEGGNYGLTLQRLNPTMGTAINYGENKQAAIGLTAELDSYLFTGSPNDVIRLVVTVSSGGPSFVSLVEIYRPNGTLFKRLLGSNLVFDTTLTDLQVCGRYTIWIMDDNGLEGGNYGLSLSRLNAGPICPSLPVTWLYFKCSPQGKDIQLTWATASEQNSKEFIVERSLDGLNYITIGAVPAVGNSSQTTTYQYTDINAMSLNTREVYYRLKQVDFDNKFDYSSVVKIKAKQNAAESLVNTYPNPFTTTITLQLNEPALGSTNRVELFSSEGKLIYQRRLSNSNSTTVTLSDLPVLSNGIYLLKGVLNGKMFSVKIVKNE